MNLETLFLTENACYQTGTKIVVKGLMLHSTAANNPWLKRYVGPDDGRLGVNKYGNHWNVYHPGGKNIGPHTYKDKSKDGLCDACGGRQVCAHGFIGKLKNGAIGTYQTLPWNINGWHAGGSANSGYIGIEICEDSTNDPDYAKATYKEAVELFAFLCKKFNLDPSKDGVIICHCEGAQRGIASNHADVMHWWRKHGLTMDGFRTDVAAKLAGAVAKKDDTEKSFSLKVGDKVFFTGTKHYVGSNTTNGKTCKPGPAKITAIAPGKVHPYHLVSLSGKGSDVYGWVDVADIAVETTVVPYCAKTVELLNIRKGPGLNFEIAGHLMKGTIRIIDAEASGWGKLQNGKGWVLLEYMKKDK